MNIYHATYSASSESYKRHTIGIRAFTFNEAYEDAVKYLPNAKSEMQEKCVELESITKGVKAI